MLSDEEATKLFTPGPEAQTMRILNNQCPYNQGWGRAWPQRRLLQV